jgi:magnesium transporter
VKNLSKPKSIIKSARIRLPWLFASCVGGIIAFFIIAKFEGSLNKIAALAVAVCMAVVSSMSVAALVGSLVPMGFARINVDPAFATGPFVTTAVDIISVSFYFIIATTLLGI